MTLIGDAKVLIIEPEQQYWVWKGFKSKFPFNFKINDTTLVRGFIDRIDKVGKNEYRVVDYKTSKNAKYLTDFQLLVYSEALRRVYKDVEIVHGSYIMLKHDCKSYDYTFRINDLDNCKKQKKKINSWKPPSKFSLFISDKL